jgi:putative glycosyltransferase (TIGR04372 family)
MGVRLTDCRFRPDWLLGVFGETAMQLGTFEMMKRLGWHDFETAEVKDVRPANGALVRLFEEMGTIRRSAVPNANLPEWDGYRVTLPDGRTRHSDPAAVAVMAEWERRDLPPVLTLPEDWARAGRRHFFAGRRTAFVVVHARETKRQGPGAKNDARNAYRNADIATFVPALKWLVRELGWPVVRLRGADDAPIYVRGVLDYPSDPARPELDLFLLAGARFALCTTSGPWCAASLFGTPLVQTNVAPASERPWRGVDVFLPKLILQKGKPLPFAKAVAPPYRHLYRGLAPTDVRDNDADEILEAVRAMARRTRIDRRSDLQMRFDALCAPFNPFGMRARIDQAFIGKWRHLLP